MAKLGTMGRSAILRQSNESMRLIITTIIGVVVGFLIGISFPAVNITKLHFPSSIISYVEDRNSGITTQALLNHAWTSAHQNTSKPNSTKIYVPTNPRGAERLAPGIIVPESDFYPRRLWGNPSEDLPIKQKYLVTFTVGLDQKSNIDAAVKKFSENFTILLFHYDGRTSEWDDLEWSKRAIHVSAKKQTKWWYAKRFLHPDIVAPYDYIFIWDEDLGVEHFNAEKYIALVRKHGLEISQPGLEPNKGLTWQMTKRRGDREVHKETEERPGWCSHPHLPWVSGSLGVALAGISICYCMLLLVQCRDRLEDDDKEDSIYIQSYGDLGAKAFGNTGRYITEILVVISQAGGAIAYLIFIGQNLSSLFSSMKTNFATISPSIFIFLLLLPLEIALAFIRSLSTLAPFSAFADACNVLAMAMVIKEDFQLFKNFSETRRAFNGALGLPFAAGMAVFCFEGFSMTLALEASMAERGKFRHVLSSAFLGITLVYVCFGIFGYLAYGDETKDIITLNLPNNWVAIAVKIGLCIALAFTFPIMMHPVHDITESRLRSVGWFQKLCHRVTGAETVSLNAIRMLNVAAMAVLASFIPAFGAFISLVGSTVCAMLSFVLPATFHLTLVGSRLKSWQRWLDYVILAVGVVFASYGTYDAVMGGSASA